MADWTEAARAALDRGPAALITILATEGSAPRGPGARMVVTSDALSGTIGGGALEHQAVEQARAILSHPPGSWRVQDYPLGPLLGQCCGGRVRLMVERLDGVPSGQGPYRVALTDHVVRNPFPGEGRGPAGNGPILGSGLRRGTMAPRGPLPTSGAQFVEPIEADSLPLLMFGAGHVGRAIAAHAAALPIHLAWFDTRPAEAETPGVMLANADAMTACAARAPAGTAVVILTHDHALDYRLTAAALAGDAAFVGLIGSQTKRARFLSRLEKDGIDSTRLTCPIGIAGVIGKEPEVIAVATLAQLLMLRTAA
ncbi:xanthine dehydrogenase accessory protein XdhC [Sphingomonas sp. LB-2]|uniref:xanthine dehydrogenase accessory protein XdhC n=1 Tax=Sphingomonas caeni TaxID=2984949 RepID=UPI00222FEE31|nr:xanthine dehydrogenase accessory protein XdhC [Sphingomonas caeni]MCW3846647.1 xanthine dehydrogenase accessory protein XdhC [Sphingomonas caeni]